MAHLIKNPTTTTIDAEGKEVIITTPVEEIELEGNIRG
jgi:hypothetical protein